jgi:hypothetical protein
MFTTVEVRAELAPSALLVPDMAVLRSGAKDTVFVALEGGKFDPRTVVLGPRAEADQYQVLDGLSEGERVVISGQFLLDSESQLREAIQKMRGPGAAPKPEPAAPTASLPAAAKPAPTGEDILYVCPMPEHVSIEYEHPGKCPICAMSLVPVTRSALAQLQPGGTVEYYTCPMPEHSAVHESKPGKCPRCGMTLIPVMKIAPPPPSAAPPAPNPPLPTLYTCPMATDADVVSDQAGTCPKCAMKLVATSQVKHGKVAEEHWRKQHAAPGAQRPISPAAKP